MPRPRRKRHHGKWIMGREEMENATQQWMDDLHSPAREKLGRHFWGLARFIANRYAVKYRVDREEAFCLALEGVAKGMNTYRLGENPDGWGLKTFVSNNIEWMLVSKMPAIRYRIKLPTSGIVTRISRAIEHLKLDHPLNERSIYKVADYLNAKPTQIMAIYHAMQARDVTQGTPVRAVSMGLDATVEDKLESEWPNPEDFANRLFMRRQITKVLLTLKAREERVIRMIYGIGCDEQTLEQIGNNMGISRERVRQIALKGLRKMKHPSRTRLLVARSALNSIELSKFEFHRRQTKTLSEERRDKYFAGYWGNSADMTELMFGKLPYQA